MLHHVRLPHRLTQWLATLSPLWQRVVLIASIVLVLFGTIVSVNLGVNLLFGGKTDPTYTGTPNTAAGVTLNGSHPSGKPLPSQPGTGSSTAPTTAAATKFTPTMSPLVIALTPGKALHATSSDGAIDITIPANALTATGAAPKLSTATGIVTTTLVATTSTAPTQLVTTQLAGPSGSAESGGTISLGTYLLQLQDSAGHEVTTATLQQPVTMTYHLPKHLTTAPQRIYARLNGGALPATARQAHLGQPQVQLPVVDATGQTVTASVPVGTSVRATAAATAPGTTAPLAAAMPLDTGSGSATVGWLTNAPEAYFGKADSFHADLQSGGLSTEAPIDLPSGPGGLTPPVHLAYSSASVNGTHGLQAAASWVGLGWSLDMGEITWSEVDRGSCPACTKEYNSSWSLSDPYGTSATLVPPNTSVATYYDDTINNPVNAPTVWHTATDSHIKVVSYTNPTVDAAHFPPYNGTTGYTSQPPCFRVWLTNGIMEEFGCTPDSRQFFPGWTSHTTNYMSAWKLDLITDPSGNQIHITYNDDMVTDPAGGNSYPRDVEPATIQWDAPACHNAQTMCTGANWQPQLQVAFNATHQVANPLGATCGAPNPDNSRCDDPEAVGVAAAPLVESTAVLNSLAVQATPTGNQSAWNTLRSYKFSYSQSSWSVNSYDAVSGLPSGAAGELLLQQVQELGTDGATSYPPETFRYQTEAQNYLNNFIPANKGQTTATLDGYYGGVGEAWDTTTSVNGSYQVNAIFGSLYTSAQPGTVALYNCLDGSDHFNSLDSKCEGKTTLTLLGFVYDPTKPAPQNVATVPIYRCYRTNDHFTATVSTCYGSHVDQLQGYLLAPPALTPIFRFYGGPGEHWETTGTVPNTYTRQLTLGALASTSQTGLTQLNGCLINGYDHFLSDLAGECTQSGTSVVRLEGFLPTTATGGYTQGFYRCYINGDHFASIAANCEGQQVEYQLGYLTPIPTSECGPSWNTGACHLWAQTNHSYMISADNGEGAHQDFTWVEAHNNTHNVPSGLNALDPTACNGTQRGNGACVNADDGAWSQEVLASQTTTTISATNQPLINKTTYGYNLSNLTSVMCQDCQVGMYWGDENDGDYLDFYNTQFKGFHLVQENRQDGSSVQHTFDATEGIGVFDANLVNSQKQCQNAFNDSNNHQIACTTSAAWDLTNAASGRETQTDTFDPQGKLLQRALTTYTATCPPSGVGASPAVGWYGTWDGHLVGELDESNPATVCDVQTQQTTTYTVNGATTTPTASNVPTATTAYTYDSYGRTTKTETTSNAGTPNDIVHTTSYIWNDAISLPNPGVPTGTYIIDTAASDATVDSGGTTQACAYHDYDGSGFASGQQSALTRGLATGHEQYAACAPFQYANWVATDTSYNANGDPVSTTDADALHNVAGHTGNGTNGACNGTSTCTTYDATYGFLNTTTGNALYQSGTQGTRRPPPGAMGSGRRARPTKIIRPRPSRMIR